MPRDSSWFSFWNGSSLIPLQEQPQLWEEDRLGLRRLDSKGGLIFDSAPGYHMQFSLPWFATNVIEQYLR